MLILLSASWASSNKGIALEYFSSASALSFSIYTDFISSSFFLEIAASSCFEAIAVFWLISYNKISTYSFS